MYKYKDGLRFCKCWPCSTYADMLLFFPLSNTSQLHLSMEASVPFNSSLQRVTVINKLLYFTLANTRQFHLSMEAISGDEIACSLRYCWCKRHNPRGGAAKYTLRHLSPFSAWLCCWLICLSRQQYRQLHRLARGERATVPLKSKLPPSCTMQVVSRYTNCVIHNRNCVVCNVENL